MNKPLYKSTGVLGSLAVIASALVALAAELAALKGVEVTPAVQAQIVGVVVALAGGVAALIGRLKADLPVGAAPAAPPPQPPSVPAELVAVPDPAQAQLAETLARVADVLAALAPAQPANHQPDKEPPHA